MRIEKRLCSGPAAFALLALLVTSAPAPARAQAKPEAESGASQPAETKAPPAADTKSDKKATSRRKAFKPSERISADTAVAFPVDI